MPSPLGALQGRGVQQDAADRAPSLDAPVVVAVLAGDAGALCPGRVVRWRSHRCPSWVIRVDFAKSAACPVWGVISEMPTPAMNRALSKKPRKTPEKMPSPPDERVRA